MSDACALYNVYTQSTVTGIASQALVPVIVSAREGLLDRKAYDEAHASPIDEPEREKQDAEPVPVAA